MGELQQQGRFADARLPGQQRHRTGYDPAAQHAVQLRRRQGPRGAACPPRGSASSTNSELAFGRSNRYSFDRLPRAAAVAVGGRKRGLTSTSGRGRTAHPAGTEAHPLGTFVSAIGTGEYRPPLRSLAFTTAPPTQSLVFRSPSHTCRSTESSPAVPRLSPARPPVILSLSKDLRQYNKQRPPKSAASCQ